MTVKTETDCFSHCINTGILVFTFNKTFLKLHHLLRHKFLKFYDFRIRMQLSLVSFTGSSIF